MRFIFIYFTSIQFNKKFKNNISPKFNSKDYSKLFISDQFNSKFNSKLWNWLDSIQQNIHSIWKCGYRSGLSVGHKKCWENSRNVGPKNDPKMQIWSFLGHVLAQNVKPFHWVGGRIIQHNAAEPLTRCVGWLKISDILPLKLPGKQ